MPFHLEYLEEEEDCLEQNLAYMYQTKRFQGLFGEASFYHKNPGIKVSAGKRNILAGVLMRHIAMVRSTNRVILKGLSCPDRRFPLQRMDEEDPEEIKVEVTRSVHELMMEKKIRGT